LLKKRRSKIDDDEDDDDVHSLIDDDDSMIQIAGEYNGPASCLVVLDALIEQNLERPQMFL
jgi:hypothetical protein